MYQIIYDSGQEDPEKGSGFRRFVLTLSFFLCFLWLVSAFWPEGKARLLALVLPGEGVRGALDAVEVFAQDLENGSSLMDALGGFRSAIFDHGYPG